MKYFERNRRRLMKKHYIRGTQKSVSGTSSVLIDDSAGVPIKMLEIVGKTTQDGTPTPDLPIPIQNANDNGMSVVLHGKNLATAQQVCTGFASYKEVEYEGRQCVSFKQNNSKKFVLEGGFKPKTQYTISFENTSVGTNSTSCMCVFYEEIGTAYDRDVIFVSTNWQKRVFTTLEGYTVKSIGLYNVDYRRTIYIDVNTFMLQEGAITDPVYEPYFRETVEIPTNIDVNGTNVPLLFSEYDKISVDGISNKVIYTEGSYTRVYKGTEYFYQNSWAENNGYGRYICGSANLPVINTGLCSHFLRRNWVPPASSKNVYVVADMENGYHRLFFKTDGSIEDTFENSMNEFKAFLKQQYDEGNPVTVIAQQGTPIEHDITSTDLGQALLSLCVPKGASGTLEITSNLEPTSLDVVYYSEIEEDKVELTVCYVNEAGEDIAEPKAYQVRRGSKYQMVVPHIDGYTRTQESVFGVASINDVINLIYKEDNDVSV